MQLNENLNTVVSYATAMPLWVCLHENSKKNNTVDFGYIWRFIFCENLLCMAFPSLLSPLSIHMDSGRIYLYNSSVNCDRKALQNIEFSNTTEIHYMRDNGGNKVCSSKLLLLRLLLIWKVEVTIKQSGSIVEVDGFNISENTSKLYTLDISQCKVMK